MDAYDTPAAFGGRHKPIPPPGEGRSFTRTLTTCGFTASVRTGRTLKFEATKDDILCTAHLSACYLQSLNFRKKVYVIGSEGKAPSMNQRHYEMYIM